MAWTEEARKAAAETRRRNASSTMRKAHSFAKKHRAKMPAFNPADGYSDSAKARKELADRIKSLRQANKGFDSGRQTMLANAALSSTARRNALRLKGK